MFQIFKKICSQQLQIANFDLKVFSLDDKFRQTIEVDVSTCGNDQLKKYVEASLTFKWFGTTLIRKISSCEDREEQSI